MPEDVLTELIAQAKIKCDVTWSDPATERKFADIVPEACAYVRRVSGIPESVEFDFTQVGTIENMLFRARCYYAFHNAEDDFAANYANDIAHARQMWEVAGNAKEQEAAS